MPSTTSPQPAIGIDLGTTNSLIAVWRDGSAELIPNSLGEVLTPSVVSAADDGTLLVGAAAAARKITHPERTAAAFKRFMGSSRQFDLGNNIRLTAPELSALVLKSLKEDAERHLQQPVTEVVISVPAYFSDEQRKHTGFAAELAGLDAVRLINEPTAAAMAYGLQDRDNRLSLVFDLGGGTFDVTLLEYASPVIEVRASTGDNFLGGEDFTQAIVDACLRDWQLPSADVATTDLARLVHQAERFKQRPPAQRHSLEWHYQETVYRWQWPADSRLSPWQALLQRLRTPIERALRDARLDPRQLDSIVMVGGSTRLWESQQLVAQLFGKMPLRHLDPDTVVAIGAAAQAACRQRDAAVREIIMTDVSPYTLGIEIATDIGDRTMNGIMSPIIERNTTIPASRQKRYYTRYDNQEHIRIAIYQGERPRVADNIHIDDIELKVPPAPAGQQAVDVRFSYDNDGLLEVDVCLESTGERVSRVIDRSPSGLSDAQKAESHQRLADLKIHPREEMPNRTLQARLESAYSQALGQQRDQILQWIGLFEQVLAKQDPREIALTRQNVENKLAEQGW